MFSYSTEYYVSPPVDQYLKFKNRCSLIHTHSGPCLHFWYHFFYILFQISTEHSPNKEWRHILIMYSFIVRTLKSLNKYCWHKNCTCVEFAEENILLGVMRFFHNNGLYHKINIYFIVCCHQSPHHHLYMARKLNYLRLCKYARVCTRILPILLVYNIVKRIDIHIETSIFAFRFALRNILRAYTYLLVVSLNKKTLVPKPLTIIEMA